MPPVPFGDEGNGLLNTVIKERMGRSRRWLAKYPRAVPVAIFLLVAAVTALSVFAIERVETQRSRAQLDASVTGIGAALERRANTTSAYLRAGSSLFSSIGDVPPARFRNFVTELRLDAAYSGTDGVGWAKRVDASAIAEFEAETAKLIDAPFTVTPAPDGNQPFVVPVTYLQPPTVRNRRAVGYDMYSDPVRRAAMIDAERNARPTASGRVVLVQEGDGSAPGFLVYMPVFRLSDGVRVLDGFIYSPINAQEFLQSALELENVGDVAIRVYDQSIGADNLLATAGAANPKGDRLALPVNVANRRWMVEVRGVQPNTLSRLSLVTLVFGLLVASLLMLLMRMLTQQANEDARTLAMLEEQASIRNSLTRELNHRVKNTLANVLSIIALTKRRADSLEEFADGLEGRVRALSATHDLLTSSDWGVTPLREVVLAELAPYAKSADHELNLDGPDISLAPSDALALGLAIHELATNAAKYGALSEPGGCVTVRWMAIADRLARVEWVESGGPPVAQDRKAGFGTDLLERIVAHELKNPIDLKFPPEGVRCTMVIPLREPSDFAVRGTAGK